MELICLGSSSRGNGYILVNDKEALVIEAGVSFKSLKKALNYNITKIRGMIYSHDHLDHSKYADEYRKAGIPVYSHFNKPIKLGNFKIKPVPVKHDIPCLSFLIKHPETGLISFLTDSFYIPFKIKSLNQIIWEANYSEDILEENIASGKLEPIVRNRVICSHMSLQTLKKALLENDLSQVNNIILIHLSGQNSNADRFKKEIEELTGKMVYIASKDLQINFNINPF